MAVRTQVLNDQYAIYCGDSCEVVQKIKSESIHHCIYSPPFAVDSPSGGGGCLYNYSSSDRDFSNARTYAEFFEQYEFLVTEIHRILLPAFIAWMFQRLEQTSAGTVTFRATSFVSTSDLDSSTFRESAFGKSRLRCGIEPCRRHWPIGKSAKTQRERMLQRLII